MTTTTTIDTLRARLRPVLLGTGNFGGIAAQVGPGIGPDAQQADAVMNRAVEVGIDVFDTADVYGLGASEQLVGAWLRAHPDTDVVVQTKMGNTATGPNLAPERVTGQLQHSIDVLGRVDLFLAHIVDPNTPWERSLPAFARPVADGTILAYGISNVTAKDLTDALKTGSCPLPISDHSGGRRSEIHPRARPLGSRTGHRPGLPPRQAGI